MEPFDDPVLGHVEWNERFGHWIARYVLPDGDAVEFDIEDNSAEGLQHARIAYNYLERREDFLRTELAERMLETANDWRLGRELVEPEISTPSFAERVKLYAVTLGRDGGFTLEYSDGGMFGNHTIVVGVGADRVMGEPALWS